MKPLKILSRIGVVLLVIVAAVLVVRAVLNFAEGRALARTLAGLKAQGVPLTAKDLAPSCSDEDNAARLWRAVENIVILPGGQTQGSGRPSPGDRSRRKAAAAAGLLIGRAWTDFTAGKPLAGADKAALKDVILENARAFELVAEMGEKPCFLYRDPAETLMESRLPSAVQMIQMTKLLFFSAIFSAEDGDVRGAISKLMTGLKFTPLVAREGTMIAFLISLADTRILSQLLSEICRGRALDDGDFARLMSVQDPSPWRERLAAAFRGERVMFVEYGGSCLEAGLGDIGSVFEGASFWEKLGLWVLRPLLKRDMRQALPMFARLEALAGVPYYQSRAELKAHDLQIEKRPRYDLSKMLIGNAEAVFMKEAQIEAIMLASRAGLACRLYKSRNGSYPENLGALVPGILKEVPIDPFTGNPLIYRREGEGFIVYSFGSNQKDDGGRSTYMITQLVMDKDDDWTWKEDK
jgi:hypothetical protein